MNNNITEKNVSASDIAIKFAEWLVSSDKYFEPYFNHKPGMWVDSKNNEYTTNELLNEFIVKHYNHGK